MTNPWNTNAGDAGDHGGNMRQLETNELIDVGGGSFILPPAWHEGLGGQPVVIPDWLPVGPEALPKQIVDTLGP